MEATNPERLQRFIPEEFRIERVHDITPEDFINLYYNLQKPVILTGLATKWPAVQKWTWDYLNQVIGERKHNFHFENRQTLQLKVSDYIGLSKAYLSHYQEGKKLNKNTLMDLGFPDLPSKWESVPYIRHFGPLKNNSNKILYDDLDTRCMFPTDKAYETADYLFMGLPGTKTEIHFDGTHNFVSIIKGQKHIALLPPGEHLSLFDGASEEQIAVWKSKTVFPMADPENLVLNLEKLEDLEKGKDFSNVTLMHEHPRLKSTKGLQYSPVYEGEIVFFPAYWYHYIHNVDLSLSITTQSFELPY